MATTDQLELTLLAANPAQPEVTVNDDLGVLDVAVAGELVQSVSADASIVIATSAGASGFAPWHHDVLTVADATAVLTGAQDVVLPSGNRKGYTARNTTLHSLVFRVQGGANGVTVNPGESRRLRGYGSSMQEDHSHPYSQNVTTITGTTFTVGKSTDGKLVAFTNAASVTVTLPQNIDSGFSCKFLQRGAGQVKFVAGTSATVEYAASAIAAQYKGAETAIVAANKWAVWGDLA